MAEDATKEFGRRPGSAALLESYISGPECSVEGYVADGKVTVVDPSGSLHSASCIAAGPRP